MEEIIKNKAIPEDTPAVYIFSVLKLAQCEFVQGCDIDEVSRYIFRYHSSAVTPPLDTPRQVKSFLLTGKILIKNNLLEQAITDCWLISTITARINKLIPGGFNMDEKIFPNNTGMKERKANTVQQTFGITKAKRMPAMDRMQALHGPAQRLKNRGISIAEAATILYENQPFSDEYKLTFSTLENKLLDTWFFLEHPRHYNQAIKDNLGTKGIKDLRRKVGRNPKVQQHEGGKYKRNEDIPLDSKPVVEEVESAWEEMQSDASDAAEELPEQEEDITTLPSMYLDILNMIDTRPNNPSTEEIYQVYLNTLSLGNLCDIAYHTIIEALAIMKEEGLIKPHRVERFDADSSEDSNMKVNWSVVE